MAIEATLVCELQRGGPFSVVVVSGRLGIASTPALRRAVHKALTDQPDVILIDVSGMTVEEDLALTALPMLARHAAGDGVAIVLVAPGATLRAQLETLGITRRVPVAESRAAALALHAHTPGARQAEAVLAPNPSATGVARQLVEESCRRWRVTHLADTAALIVTELVANGVEHAGTRMRLSLSLRDRHLHISLHDGSRRVPRQVVCDDDRESGRGLLIIEGLSTAWGCTEVADGKVVWVTLRRAERHQP